MRKISSLIIIAYSAGIVYPAGACFMSCFGGRATCGCCIPQQIGPEPEIKAIQEKINEHDATLKVINGRVNQLECGSKIDTEKKELKFKVRNEIIFVPMNFLKENGDGTYSFIFNGIMKDLKGQELLNYRHLSDKFPEGMSLTPLSK